MTLDQQLTLGLRLLLAALLAMIVGMDRERLQKSAGLRTHMLAGLGSCLFTILSFYGFPAGDPTRIASSVVVGIGFLGAGTIVQNQGQARDLTTAASIWATAAIGMTVGMGAWLLSAIATISIWFILAILRRFEEEKNPPKPPPKS